MKVLLLGDISSAHLQKFAISFSKNGIDVGIFSFNHAEVEWWKNETRITILHQTAKKKSSHSIITKLSYLFLIGKLNKAIRFFQPDILHAHYASSYGLLGRLSGFHPFVISVWGTDVMKFPLHNVINKYILTKNLEHADLIFATSNVLKYHCEKYTTKTTEVIPFGIDLNKFSFTDKIPKNEIIIGCVKSLEPIYRIDLLIDAFALIHKQIKNITVKLLIIGGGSLDKELKSKVNELGLQHSVEFTGKIPNNEVPSFYKNMDIFCNLSTYESFGVSIIEAMACGVPVIATPTDGAKEIIVNNDLGLIVNSWDKTEIANTMKKLIEDDILRKQISQNAYKYVEINFDWKNSVFTMIEKYNSLIKKK